MASWQSHTHYVEGRNYAVMEHASDQIMVNGIATGIASSWRTVQDAQTGEVVRRFDPATGAYAPPNYDFTEGQQWLEKRFGAPKQVPQHYSAGALNFGGSASGTSTWTINTGKLMAYIPKAAHTHETNDAVEKNPGPHLGGVPGDSTYIAEAKYGGVCRTCGMRVERGSPIWWRRSLAEDRSMIYCGHHKTAPAATAAGEDTNTENDMAQRQDFTFPYTGAEIAASLERKAAKLDAQQQPKPKLDLATLKLVYPSYSDEDIAEVIKGKDRDRERINEKLAKEAAEIRKEAIPYAKASKASFEIDIEDIEFFGLNDEDAPVKAKRTRRTKEQVAADKASEELVSA